MTAVEWTMSCASLLPVDEHERDFGFADGLVVDRAGAFGFADFSAGLDELDLDDDAVAWAHGLAPADALGGHEVGELAEVLGLAEHENAGDLGDRFELQD